MTLPDDAAIRTFEIGFQYRKRYEITCDKNIAVEILDEAIGFNTASGMRSHVTRRRGASWTTSFKGFNTASGMRSHVTMSCTAGFESIMVVSIPQAV